MNDIAQAIPAGVSAAMRPGCVYLSVDLWFANPGQMEATQAAMPRKLLEVSHNEAVVPFWARQDTHIILPDSEHQVRS
jgi:hypothetical protein